MWGRSSETNPLVICGYTGHPKEVIWMEALALTVAVPAVFPFRGSTKKKREVLLPLGLHI